MNKSVKRLVSVLLAVLVLAALGASALAEGDTYTVRLFAGSGGLDTEAGEVARFSDGSNVIVKQCHAGDPFPFSVDGLNESMTFDEKYYVKCIRPSGHDNNTIETTPATVTEDADYVVGYGIRGELVAYTVNFVDEAGNTLAPSQTYYGNVGDKPVVAYVYIDGYQPQAYNLTKTLLDDAGQNVIDFVYTPVVVVTPEPVVQPTPYVYTEGAATAPEAAETEEIGGGAAPAGGGAAAPAPDAAAAAGPEAELAEAEPEQEPETANIEDDQTPLNQGPAEVIDLDDTPSGETPEIKEKPKTEIQQERDQSESKLYVSLGLLGVSLVVIAALVVALVRKRGAKS